MALPPPGAAANAPAAPGAGAAAPGQVPTALGVGFTVRKAPEPLLTFAFSQADVVAAATDLLAKLPPPRADIKPNGYGKKSIAVIGPKGGSKTIASLAVKTNRCAGLPRPEGSIAVCLHVDNQAPGSFDNFLWEQDVVLAEGEAVHFIGMGEPVGRYKGRVGTNDPACSAYVKEVVLEMARQLGTRDDVGLFVFDGYGDYTNNYGNYVAAYANGFNSPLKLEGTQWQPRREFFTDNMAHGLIALSSKGGFFVYNGQEGGLEQEKEKEPAKLAKRLAKEGFAGREPPSKWYMYRENNQNADATITLEVGVFPGRPPPFSAEVWDGRMGRLGFSTGVEKNITGKNLGVFWEERIVKPTSTPSATLPPAPFSPTQGVLNP